MSGRKQDGEDVVDFFDAQDGTNYDPDGENEDDGDDSTGEADSSGSSDEDSSSGDERSSRARTADTDGDEAGTPAVKLTALRNGMQQDAQGNLYDQKGGLIARAGSERRLFERNARMGIMVEEGSTRVKQLETELNAYKQNDGIQRQYGLTQEDLTAGLPIIGEFKKDPLSAAKRIVEMVAGMGYNISDILGKDAGDAIELKAVSRMLDERLKPLTKMSEREAAQERQQAADREAEKAVVSFFERHENAEMHGADIDRLLGLRPELSPEQAYYEIKLFAQREGLDFNLPLAPQMQSRIDSVQGVSQQTTNNRQQTRYNPPLPNGSAGRQRAQAVNEDQFDDARAEWGDIISAAMQGR